MKVVYTETFATAVNTALKFASKISFFFVGKVNHGTFLALPLGWVRELRKFEANFLKIKAIHPHP